MATGIRCRNVLFVLQELSKALEDTDVGVMTAAVQVGAGWAHAWARASRLLPWRDAPNRHRCD